MEWSLGFDWRALGDPVSEGRRVWEWIQRVRPLHPSLDLWRPTAGSREEAEQSPSMTQDYLLQLIRGVQALSDDPDFGLAPAFCGQIDQGNKLELSFNMPNPGSARPPWMPARTWPMPSCAPLPVSSPPISLEH